MLKRTITYKDFNGTERTEDFYFNITKAELLDMEIAQEGGLKDYLERIINAKDGKKIYETMRNFILKAYGEKSPDGKRFIKSPELTEAFTQTEAFSDLILDLTTDADKAAAFVNGIMPSDLDEFLRKRKLLDDATKTIPFPVNPDATDNNS